MSGLKFRSGKNFLRGHNYWDISYPDSHTYDICDEDLITNWLNLFLNDEIRCQYNN